MVKYVYNDAYVHEAWKNYILDTIDMGAIKNELKSPWQRRDEEIF